MAANPTELTRTVKELYATFATYRYRASMPACAHCVTDDDLLALGRHPLAKLPAALLGRYTIKAVSTWGEVPDFKWLLPRLGELLAGGWLPVPADALTTKLTRAWWEAWPPPERDAVRAFLRAWWDAGLHDVDAAVVTERLPAIAAAESDLSASITLWQRHLSTEHGARLAALTHLTELVCNSRFRPDHPATLGAVFWEPAGPAAEQLSAWLASRALADALDRAIYDFATSAEARRLAIAAARLRRFRTTRPRPR